MIWLRKIVKIVQLNVRYQKIVQNVPLIIQYYHILNLKKGVYKNKEIIE
jgi:hypothetical protein